MKPHVPGIPPERIMDNVPEDYTGPLMFALWEDQNFPWQERDRGERVDVERWRRFDLNDKGPDGPIAPGGVLAPEWHEPLQRRLDGPEVLKPEWDIIGEPSDMSQRVHDVFVAHGEPQNGYFMPYDILRPGGLPPVRRYMMVNQNVTRAVIEESIPPRAKWMASWIDDEGFALVDASVIGLRHNVRIFDLRYTMTGTFLEALGDVFADNVKIRPVGVATRDEWLARRAR